MVANKVTAEKFDGVSEKVHSFVLAQRNRVPRQTHLPWINDMLGYLHDKDVNELYPDHLKEIHTLLSYNLIAI